jgi:hypothetical protein
MPMKEKATIPSSPSAIEFPLRKDLRMNPYGLPKLTGRSITQPVPPAAANAMGFVNLSR